VIYREMLKKYSSQEPIGQFEPNVIGNMLGGWGFRTRRHRFVQMKFLGSQMATT